MMTPRRLFSRAAVRTPAGTETELNFYKEKKNKKLHMGHLGQIWIL